MCYNHYLAKQYHKENFKITCTVLFDVFTLRGQRVVTRGTEIPLPCNLDFKLELSSVASWLEVKSLYQNSIVL